MTKQRILAVDDDKRLLSMIEMILMNRGYEVIKGHNGQEAIDKVKSEAPDLVLLDVMMPIMDGFSACEIIRQISDAPIIMLTAKGEDYDQVHGLELGADDYVVKPFTPMVLAARVQAALRRQKVQEVKEISCETICIEMLGRRVTIDGQIIPVNRKEYDLLLYLMQNKDITLSRDQILEKIWGYDYLGSESTVDAHMNRLRKKMFPYGHYIVTVRGYGYRFEVPNAH